MILILGSPDDPHAALIHTKVQRRGESSAYLDTREFPSTLKLSFIPKDAESGYLYHSIREEKIPFSTIRAVYWRTFTGIKAKDYDAPHLKEIATREIDSAIGSLFRSLNCLWVNSYAAIEQHRYKGYQLHLLHRAGLCVPETVITNDGEEVREFYHCLNKKVIYKPVRGGAHAALLSEADLTDERLQELSEAPVQFQEYIPGEDIRVYLVKDHLFAAEILTEALDFRKDPNARINPITLPDPVAQDCFTLARMLGLSFTGIDIRRTPEGKYVFLEGNPSPMFVYFEKVTGYPISDRLVDLLMQGT